MNSVACPACHSMGAVDLGPLPALRPGTFGGIAQDVSLTGGHLMHCRECDLRFRHPCLSDDELRRLYEYLPETIWESYTARAYWPLAGRLLEAYAASEKVLDVGCFGGDLLHWLPAKWQKHGLEPCKAAYDLAARRGITMLGSSIENLQGFENKFGGVLLFDVIEHMTGSLPFLARLRDSLLPRGCLIVLTGATDSWPYRLFGRRFWYGALPEHVSFYSLRWFTWAADALGMQVRVHYRISSEERHWKLWFIQFLQLTAHSLVSALREAGVDETALRRVPLLGRVAGWSGTPSWKQSADHILIVLTKPV